MVDGFWMYVIFGVVTVILLLRTGRTNESVAEVAFQITLAFYLSRVAALTFFPIPSDPTLLAEERELHAMGFGQTNNFTLFKTISDTSGWTFNRQILGNLVLLFPLGVLAPMAARYFQSPKRAIALTSGVAIGIETMQLAISTILGFTFKTFDVDDLWLNALGGLLGVGVGLTTVHGKLYTRITRRSIPHETITPASLS